MKNLMSFSILLLLSFLSLSIATGADLESASELYLKSGLEKQMGDIGPALLAGYQNNYNQSKNLTLHDKNVNRNISLIIENSFDIQAMKATVISGIMNNISEFDITQILHWLNSSAGKKITALEEMSGSKKGMEETQRYIRELKKSSVSKERVRIIKALNSSMQIEETTIDIALCTQFALLMTFKKKDKKLSYDDIQNLYANFKKNREQIEPMVQHQVHGSLLYTYQTLPDEPLDKYLFFAQSESGKNYSRVTSQLIVQTITDSSLQFAFEIAQLP